jgi:hypothetical protein
MELHEWLPGYLEQHHWSSVLEVGAMHGAFSRWLLLCSDSLTILEPNVHAEVWQKLPQLCSDQTLFQHLPRDTHYDLTVLLGLLSHLHSPFHALDLAMQHSSEIIADYPISEKTHVRSAHDQSDRDKWCLMLETSLIPRYMAAHHWTCAIELDVQRWGNHLPHKVWHFKQLVGQLYEPKLLGSTLAHVPNI